MIGVGEGAPQREAPLFQSAVTVFLDSPAVLPLWNQSKQLQQQQQVEHLHNPWTISPSPPLHTPISLSIFLPLLQPYVIFSFFTIFSVWHIWGRWGCILDQTDESRLLSQEQVLEKQRNLIREVLDQNDTDSRINTQWHQLIMDPQWVWAGGSSQSQWCLVTTSLSVPSHLKNHTGTTLYSWLPTVNRRVPDIEP